VLWYVVSYYERCDAIIYRDVISYKLTQPNQTCLSDDWYKLSTNYITPMQHAAVILGCLLTYLAARVANAHLNCSLLYMIDQTNYCYIYYIHDSRYSFHHIIMASADRLSIEWRGRPSKMWFKFKWRHSAPYHHLSYVLWIGRSVDYDTSSYSSSIDTALDAWTVCYEPSPLWYKLLWSCCLRR